MPNKISISGHTDATPFVGSGGFGNWELSANRANAARRALVAGTYPDSQVAVVGYASSALYDHENPTNPVNRRIDIVVLTKKAQQRIEGDQNSGGAPATKPAPAAPATPAAPGASSATPPDPQAYAQPHEIRQKLNIFDDGKLRVEPAQN